MREIAGILDDLARELSSSRQSLDASVGSSTEFWVGDDANEFRGRWDSEMAVTLSHISTEVTEVAARLRSEAASQDAVSRGV